MIDARRTWIAELAHLDSLIADAIRQLSRKNCSSTGGAQATWIRSLDARLMKRHATIAGLLHVRASTSWPW